MTDINKMVQEAGTLTKAGEMVGNVRKGVNKSVSGMKSEWRDAKISAGSGSFKDHASQLKDKAIAGATKVGQAGVKLVKDNPEFSKGAAAATGIVGTGVMAKKFLSRKKQ